MNSSIARNELGHRKCTRCELWQDVSCFGKDAKMADGMYMYCRTCSREMSLIKRYGITTAQFDAMLEEQGGKCKICSQVPEKFYVDHDHNCCASQYTCGKCVRGILCNNCNTRLGWLDRHSDNIKEYLANG